MDAATTHGGVITNHLNQSLSAEYLVASHLTSLGYIVSTAAAGLAYDLLVDIGNQVLRIQVKSCREERKNLQNKTALRYIFTSNQKYSITAFDIMALVASDIGVVAYLPVSEVAGKPKIYLAGPDSCAKTQKIHELPFGVALLKHQAPTFSMDEHIGNGLSGKKTK